MKTVSGVTYILKSQEINGCESCVAHGNQPLCQKLICMDCLMSDVSWVEAPQDTPGLAEEQDRAAFEEACLVQFAAWRAAGNTADDNGCENTRESLCWREPDGTYGVLALNSAWWGWKAKGGVL
jgi:hypothetical protein